MRLSRKQNPAALPTPLTSSPSFQAPAGLPFRTATRPVSRWLHRWAVLTSMATLALVAAGGLVTSHGVGMAVPDWPNTYGYNMFFFPPSHWVGGIFYEHTHRLIASIVGLMTSILAVWLFGKQARRFLRWTGLALLVIAAASFAAASARWADAIVAAVAGAAALGSSFAWPACDPAPAWLRRLGVAAFFAVVLQGVLGGLRVVMFKDQIGIFHALLAQLFLALVCSIALFTSKWWQRATEARPANEFVSRSREARWLFVGTTLLILFQLVLGATMRHQHAGLAVPDFPLAYGKLWPATDPVSVTSYNQRRLEVTALNPITSAQIVLQMVHRIMALVITAAVGICAWSARRRNDSAVRKLAAVWLGLIVAQVLLGAATVWSNKAADIATGHVLVGALSLVVGVLTCIISSSRPALAEPSSEQRHEPASPQLFLAPQPAPAAGT